MIRETGLDSRWRKRTIGWLLILGPQLLILAGRPAVADSGSVGGSALVFESSPLAGIRPLGGSQAGLKIIDFHDFGEAVAISGNTAVIGAPLNDGPGTDAGAVFVFERDADDSDTWELVATLSASDAADDDGFGEAVAISGSTVIVGARLNDDTGANSGSAYIFDRDQGGPGNWGEVTKLTDPLAGVIDLFGKSVAISGSTAVVTSSAGSGRAYVFERDQDGPDAWGEVTRFTTGALSGAAALSGDILAIGDLFDDEAAENAGAAFVFERNEGGPDNWGLVKKLLASDAADSDLFGTSVAVGGNTAAVGAERVDDPVAGDRIGAVYVFRRDEGGLDNWGEVKKLTASDAEAFDQLGTSVAIDGDTLIGGARGGDDDDAGKGVGAVYLFDRNLGGVDNWGEVVKVNASDAALNDVFGASVGISGDQAVVGAPGNDVGAAYVFLALDPDTWVETEKLVAQSLWTETGDLNHPRIAHAASKLADGRVLVTAGTDRADLSATAELFDPSPGTWTETGLLNHARDFHSQTGLADGRVLVAGGFVNFASEIGTTEIYDPATGQWEDTDRQATATAWHTATLLPDGRVLAAGGMGNNGNPSTVAQIYDPATELWSLTDNLSFARQRHTATLLMDGRVLVVGGDIGQQGTCEIYDPATGLWSVTGNLNAGRTIHTATLLNDGKVLVAGGIAVVQELASAELYDPTTGIWTPTDDLEVGRSRHTATRLTDGKVLIAGGERSGDAISHAEIYDPASGTWQVTNYFNTTREEHIAVLLTDGRVLATGGHDDSGCCFDALSSSELFGTAMPFFTDGFESGDVSAW